MIAFALACNTSVLVMDEPTNGLDIPSKGEFRKLMAETITDDKIFIISTHQVRDLDHVLDHILIVNSGNIVLNASLSEITQKIAFNFYSYPPESQTIIAIEEIIGGYAVKEENKKNEETSINLEQLFTTAILQTAHVQSLFK